MNANVYSYNKSLEVFESVKIIRIKDKKYNILIMRDYLPLIGEIDGDVTIITDKFEKKFSDIKGYYIHKKNKFELLIDDIY